MAQEDNIVPRVRSDFYEYHKYYDKSFSEYHKNLKKHRLTGLCDKNFMLSLINSTLDKFVDKTFTVRDYSDEKVSWNIEYGTKPLEETVKTYEEKNRILIGRHIATEAAEKAIKNFDLFNNEIYDDTLGQAELDYIMNRKGWASLIIELRYDYWFKSFIIVITMDKGSNKAMNYVVENLYKNFNTAYHLWYLRKNYIKLTEGLQVQNGRDNVLNYLFDEGILKAVCECMC